MKRIYLADDPFQIQLGDEKYYSFADLVMNFKPEDFKVIDKATGEEDNIYKVFWDLYRDSLEAQAELYEEAELRDKFNDKDDSS